MLKKLWKTAMKTKYGFIDATDFHHELGEASGGVTIYSSLNDALENCFCAKGCGVFKVKVSYVETALAGKEDMQEKEEKEEKEKEKEIERISHYRAKAEKLRKHVEWLNSLADRLERDLENKFEEIFLSRN